MQERDYLGIYVVVRTDDDNELISCSSIEIIMPISEAIDERSDRVIEVTARGILYESDWTQVEHAIFTRRDGESWQLFDAYYADGRKMEIEDLNAFEAEIYDTLFDEE